MSALDPVRLDRVLIERGLATSRARAQELVRRGSVLVNGRVARKCGELVSSADHVTVTEPLRFVSRGGDKLDAALDELGVDVSGLRCLDVGASTGGFTQCLLLRGASAVCALDVGHDQLAAELRADPRVVCMEGRNARDLRLEDLPFAPDLTVVDASFISLGALAPALARVARPGTALIALVKPQFEVGPAVARRTRGVVRDDALRQRAITEVHTALVAEGFRVIGGVDSAVLGPKGNREHFIHAERV
jgi:23S rRNA (cytidine1920-2'-O)/16S rRNA (cytidine1409-2'-O)-methyltransferase